MSRCISLWAPLILVVAATPATAAVFAFEAEIRSERALELVGALAIAPSAVDGSLVWIRFGPASGSANQTLPEASHARVDLAEVRVRYGLD